jgi:hypothetical protein
MDLLEARIPTEIRAYKGKLLGGLTVRQIVSIGGVLVVCVPLGIVGKNYIPSDILGWLVIFTAALFAAWGWAKWKDMKFETIIKVMFLFLLRPRQRVYEDTQMNIFVRLEETLAVEDIKEQRIECGDYDEDEYTEYAEYSEELEG